MTENTQITNNDPQYRKITNKDEFNFLSNNFDYVSKIQESVRKTTLLSPTTLAVLGVTSFTGVASFGVVPIALGTSVSGLLLLTTIWGYSNKSKELIYISSVISASLENYISYLVLVNYIIENSKEQNAADDIKILYDKININIMKYIFWILTVLEEGSNDIKKALESTEQNNKIKEWYNFFINTIEKNYRYTIEDECTYKKNKKTISDNEDCNTYGNVIRRRCDRLKDKVSTGSVLTDTLKTSVKKTFRPSYQLYRELIREYVILSGMVTMLQGQMEIYKVLHVSDYTSGVNAYVAMKTAVQGTVSVIDDNNKNEKVGGGKKSRHNRKNKKSKKTKTKKQKKQKTKQNQKK